MDRNYFIFRGCIILFQIYCFFFFEQVKQNNEKEVLENSTILGLFNLEKERHGETNDIIWDNLCTNTF